MESLGINMYIDRASRLVFALCTLSSFFEVLIVAIRSRAPEYSPPPNNCDAGIIAMRGIFVEKLIAMRCILANNCDALHISKITNCDAWLNYWNNCGALQNLAERYFSERFYWYCRCTVVACIVCSVS